MAKGSPDWPDMCEFRERNEESVQLIKGQRKEGHTPDMAADGLMRVGKEKKLRNG